MNTSKASVLYKTQAGEQSVMAIYEDALKNWPVPYKTRQIPTRHGDTFVVISGNELAPTMILLHGAGGNSSIWAGDVIDYCKEFCVYAVDLPGEAGKSTTNRPAWETSAFADWFADVLNGLGIETATLVGISQGAWAALKFAVASPSQVEALVLLSPGGIIPDRKSFLLRAIASMMLGEMGINQLVTALFGDQAVPDGVKERVVQVTSQFKPRIGVLPIFSDDELRCLNMPIFLLGGTKDIVRDVDGIAARLRSIVPNLTVKLIPGGGHALIQTSKYVMEFLNKQRALDGDTIGLR